MSNPPPTLVLILSTAPDRKAAERLARTLLDERLVACANLLPGVISLYRWKGEVRTDDEVMLLLKTTPERAERVFERIRELHPYEVPEIVRISVDAVAEEYGRWIEQETNSAAL